GYGPRLRTNAQAVDRILEAVMACGLTIDDDVAIALDVAASHLYDADSGTYLLTVGDVEDEYDALGMTDMLAHWVRQFPIRSIEDGLAEDDWEGWSALTARLGPAVQLVGDDLFSTRVDRLRQGIDRRAANAVL